MARFEVKLDQQNVMRVDFGQREPRVLVVKGERVLVGQIGSHKSGSAIHRIANQILVVDQLKIRFPIYDELLELALERVNFANFVVI